MKQYLASALIAVSAISFNAQASLFLTQCTSTQDCSEWKLKQAAKQITGNREGDVLVFDAMSRDTYHYEVVDASGLEFPGAPLVSVRRVAIVPEDVKDAVADFVDVENNAIAFVLGDQAINLGGVSGYNIYYGLINTNFTVADLQWGMNNIHSQLSSQVSDAYNRSLARIRDELSFQLSINFGKYLSASVGFQSGDSFTVILKFPDAEVGHGLVTKFTKNGNNVEAVIQAIVIIENGEVIFTIPVENNIVDWSALVGGSFTTSNYGALSNWFANFKLGLQMSVFDCNNICRVTVTDLEEPEVEDP